MMTKSEIEQATRKYSEKHIDNFHRQIGFEAGANFVNSKQPYNALDMQSFWIWANANGYFYSPLNECWLNEDNETDFATEYTIEEVIKLWEIKTGRRTNP
jgi:frataxin-like iron-binding protein CyaY